MWKQSHPSPEGGQARSCATCHAAELTNAGKHARTGKTINPLAPSANHMRLIDAGDN